MAEDVGRIKKLEDRVTRLEKINIRKLCKHPQESVYVQTASHRGRYIVYKCSKCGQCFNNLGENVSDLCIIL